MFRFIAAIKSPQIQTVVKSIIFWAIFILLLFASGIVANNLLPKTFERFSYGILGTLAAFVSTYILVKSENKSLRDYGLIWQKKTLSNFTIGVGIGFFIFTLLIICLLVFSNLTLQKNAIVLPTSHYFWLLSIIPLALMEEIAFRAYPFIQLNKFFGLRLTQIILAVSFALYHFIQGWGLQISFLGPGLWSFVFVLSAYYYKGIAVPTGIHVALNLMQQLFGVGNNNKNSIWVLAEKKVTDVTIVAADKMGLLFQIFVLIIAVILGEYLIKKERNQSSLTA